MNNEDESMEEDFDDEYYDSGGMDMGDEDEQFEDDIDEEDSDEDEEAEEDDSSGEFNGTKSTRGYCRYCGAEVILDELPDSIARDAFEQFGICLNCQWGIFMQNGGHF